MGLDTIYTFTIIADTENGECDIHYPLETNQSEFEMISILKDIIFSCYSELRNELFRDES